MQPIDPEKTPKVNIPALNHIGLWVDKLPQAVEFLAGKGLKFTPGQRAYVVLVRIYSV